MKSVGPDNDIYEYDYNIEEENKKIDAFLCKDRSTVLVQGLGFVGSAMAAALSNAKTYDGGLLYNVIGVDLADAENYWKIGRINNGKSPVISSDKNMDNAYRNAHDQKNLLATYSEYAYSKADIVVIDIHLDISKKEIGDPYNYSFSFDKYKKAIEVVAQNISENSLVIVETTVPPGTTQRVIYPIFKDIFKKRGLDINKLYLSHSYERVMPGIQYLNSIINFYRVYSGINDISKKKAGNFFESFINTKEYPLFELHSTTASEMSKVLENSFRAMNIAFIQEWTEYAQSANVNLFEVIDAIRVRPTHRNIMLPGFGVGGYCLTKDSLLADWSYNNIFNESNHLEMSLNAVKINDLMPEYAFKLLKGEMSNLARMHVSLLGISYLNGVADTRYTPSHLFYKRCKEEGAIINLHDPIVSFWAEENIDIDTNIESLRSLRHDAAIFAVRHDHYLNLTTKEILYLLNGVKVIIDANNIISDEKAKELSESGVKMIGVGKGHWKNLGVKDE